MNLNNLVVEVSNNVRAKFMLTTKKSRLAFPSFRAIEFLGSMLQMANQLFRLSDIYYPCDPIRILPMATDATIRRSKRRANDER